MYIMFTLLSIVDLEGGKFIENGTLCVCITIYSDDVGVSSIYPVQFIVIKAF